MGCVQSRRDINDVHPDVFRVVNIDEDGSPLWTGQLEVTDRELVFYRRSREPTRWPLRSLRRYGFDGDVFSFESGRRCVTGQGIYAFKCRRAEQLFNKLQQSIQVRNMASDIGMDGIEPRPPNPLPRPPTDTPTPPSYLEPAGTLRLGSVSSGPLSPEVHSPGSPSSADILEVMPLGPLPAGGVHVTNLYQLQDFPLQREHNNNRNFKMDSANHSYSNTRDINSDLATLRQELQNQQYLDDDNSSLHMHGLMSQPAGPPLSPTLSTTSEHYATLAVDQEANRMYMNLTPGDLNPLNLPSIREEISLPPLSGQLDGAQTAQTPNYIVKTKVMNFNFMNIAKMEVDEEKHNYANLGPGEVNYDPRLLSRQHSKLPRGISLDSSIVPQTPLEAMTINYAILDLDKAKEDILGEAHGLPPSSPKKPALGYTTIDFNKTVALTSVALGTEVDTEGSRKTRHNSTALPPSPTLT